jgi:hypothetical protein
MRRSSSDNFRMAVSAYWMRGLLGLLGAFELLMAASAASLTVVTFGFVAGVALIAAAILGGPGRRMLVVALVAATLPFVALTWWTIVTPLLTVVALAVGLAVTRRTLNSTAARSIASFKRLPVA